MKFTEDDIELLNCMNCQQIIQLYGKNLDGQAMNH
jgi:hypothetical protein